MSLNLPRCGTPDGFDPMPSTRKDGKPRNRNRFAASCFICGHDVPAEAGYASWSPSRNAWYVVCGRGLS